MDTASLLLRGGKRPLPAARAWLSGLLGLVVALALPAGGADWHVKEAPVRFQLSLMGRPTHPSAGYFVQIPDGGLLPTPLPLPHVVTDAGKPVAGYILWQNRSSGLALVFEDPGSARSVYVYFSPTDKLKLWSPKTGLTPSAIVCAQPGVNSLDAARNLGKMGAVGPTVHYINRAGNAASPLCLQGDQSGRPPPSSFYMLAYLESRDPGRTWVAPWFPRGNSEVRVNDQTISPQKRIDKWGGTGQWVDLSKGLHKVEIFSACDASVDYTKDGIVWFTWKTPNATIDELGGARSKDAPFPGTAKFESRVLRDSEIAKSGNCTIEEVALRDGGPAAFFTAEPRDVFWFQNETPTVVYRFSALTAGHPKDTKYVWSFGDKAKPTGPRVFWFLAGLRDQAITLTASAGNKESRCTIPLYAFSTAESSLDDSATRETFRSACLSMIQAYPTNADPTVSWDQSLWDTFFQVQELGKGGQLLAEVLVNREPFFKSKIPADKQAPLEDMLFHSLSHIAPDKALAWLKDAEKGTRSADRRNALKILQAEVIMYHFPTQRLNEAKAMLRPLAAQGMGEMPAMANLRLGDIAFLERDLNAATRLWGSVQKGFKLTDEAIKDSTVEWREDDSKDKAKPTAEPAPEAAKKKKNELKPLRPLRSSASGDAADWKKTAVLDTGMAASVMALVRQENYIEALYELRRWERMFPMSKISGDYVLQEAKFFMAIGNNARARRLLEAYCDNVDASSFVADAAELLLQCMVNDKEPDGEMSKFCERMKKRFEFHPLADRLAALLQVMRAGDGAGRAAAPRRVRREDLPEGL